MIKKNISILLSAILATTLYGCNGGSSTSDQTGQANSSTQEFAVNYVQGSTTSCLQLSNASVSSSQWWLTANVVVVNQCSSTQSLDGLKVTVINNTYKLNGSGFNLNSISPWSSNNSASFTYPSNSILVTLSSSVKLTQGQSATINFGGNPGFSTDPKTSKFTVAVNGDPVPPVDPTIEPTVTPTVTPTSTPTVEPTITPTVEPTIEPTVTPTSTPTDYPVYPEGRGTYQGGSYVYGTDGTLYKCLSNQIAPWCNSSSALFYAPGTGLAWSQAWVAVSGPTPPVDPTVEPTVTPTSTPTVEPTVEPTIEPTVQPTTPPVPVPAGKLFVAYTDLSGAGGFAAVTSAGWKKPNVIVMGFADPTTTQIDNDYLTRIQKIMDTEADGTINLLSIGGEAGSYQVTTVDPKTVANNVIAQVRAYNARLTGKNKIVGIDLDIEAGNSSSMLTTIASTIKAAGLQVSAAPQLSTNGGSTINPTSPTTLVLTGAGTGNDYGSAIAKGYIDYVFIQAYNSGPGLANFNGTIGENQPQFYSLLAQTMSTLTQDSCANPKYQVCIPKTTKMVIGTVANRIAGGQWTLMNPSGVWPFTGSYNQDQILAQLASQINTIYSDPVKYSHYDGLMYWSLNNDFYPTAWGDTYAKVGNFTFTMAPVVLGNK